MTRLPISFALVAMASLLVACSGAGGPGQSAASLDGHTYLSTRLEGAILVPGTRIRLSFADGNLNAHGGCNMMGGPTRSRATGSGPPAVQTEMACDEPVRPRTSGWPGSSATPASRSMAIR
jgi:hypothetical protein